MSSPLRVSEAASLGLHAAAYLVGGDRRRSPTRRIAEAIGVSEAHLAKVLVRLERAGIVLGTRGPGGGFELARPPERVTLQNVYEAIEGPLKTTRCMFGRRVCTGGCMLGELLEEVDAMVLERLGRTTLADLTVEFRGAARKRKAV